MINGAQRHGSAIAGQLREKGQPLGSSRGTILSAPTWCQWPQESSFFC
jgi:hypothetical protein